MLLILFVIIHLLFNQFHLLLIFYRLFHLFDLALCFFLLVLEGLLLVVLVEPHDLVMRVVLCLHILIIFELHDLPIPDIGAQMRSPQGPD